MSDGNTENLDKVGVEVEEANKLLEDFAVDVHNRVRKSFEPNIDQIQNSVATTQKRMLTDLAKMNDLSERTRESLASVEKRLEADLGKLRDEDRRIEGELKTQMQNLSGDLARHSDQTLQKHQELRDELNQQIEKLKNDWSVSIKNTETDIRSELGRIASTQQAHAARTRRWQIVTAVLGIAAALVAVAALIVVLQHR
jgi:capsid protein